MNVSDLPDTESDAVFIAYVSALKDSFGGEPWEDIESFAARIWADCRLDEAEWEAIRDKVRSEWNASPQPPREPGDA